MRWTFRRRLALAFVAVAGVSAGALAVGAVIAVTSYRHHTFRERARSEASQDLALWNPAAAPEFLIQRLEEFEEPGGPGVLVITDGRALASLETLTEESLPRGMRLDARSQGGALVEAETTIDGTSYFVVGQQLDRQEAEAYFFFTRAELLQGLQELRTTLLLGWVLVTAAAAVAGTLVARRTLRPVQEAADAARAVAEGLLATRLPGGGSDEFAQWADSFNEMVGALEDKLQALAEARDREQRFNADVAHELRTPLGALVTAATLLEGDRASIPPHLQRPVELVVDGARRMHRLVDDLLDLHNIGTGHGSIQLDTVELGEAVRSTLFAHGWEQEVALSTPASTEVEIDRWRLDRILVNLIGNARSHGGRNVRVAVGQGGNEEAYVAVSDDGPGIPPEAIPHLFDRYYKVSAARTSPSDGGPAGSGLGLSIAQENAKLLGGRISVYSVVGEGSTFTFFLPAAKEPDPDVVTPVRSADRAISRP